MLEKSILVSSSGRKCSDMDCKELHKGHCKARWNKKKDEKNDLGQEKGKMKDVWFLLLKLSRPERPVIKNNPNYRILQKR